MSRSQQGDDYRWTLENLLLASAVDALHAANWQRGGDKKAERPKRIPRPGVVDATVQKFGRGKFTTKQIDEILARVQKR